MARPSRWSRSTDVMIYWLTGSANTASWLYTAARRARRHAPGARRVRRRADRLRLLSARSLPRAARPLGAAGLPLRAADGSPGGRALPGLRAPRRVRRGRARVLSGLPGRTPRLLGAPTH